MSPKVFVGFTAVTVAIIIGSIFSIGSRFGETGSQIGTAPVFPGFAEKVNDVTEMSVQTNKETLTVKRGADGRWTIVEREGYEVPVDKIQKLLVELSESKLAEKKTAKKDRYKRIQVEDPADKGALSRVVRFKDKDGNALAELIVGRTYLDFGGVEGVGTYIRKPSDEQSWVGSGSIIVPDEVKKLVNAEFLNVATKRVNRAVILQPGGKRMEVEKIDQKRGKYRIVGLTGGVEIKYPIDVDNIGDGLENLELEDVRAKDKVAFPADKIIRTEYRTEDGLIVNVETFEKDSDVFWARFSAKAAPDAKKTDEIDPVAEAAKINAAVKDWVYQIPAFKFRYMTRKLEDVIEQPKKDGKS